MAFTDFSVHTLLVNSKALEIAGITKDTPDPPSGEMERNENGEPTGILKEPGAQALVPLFNGLLRIYLEWFQYVRSIFTRSDVKTLSRPEDLVEIETYTAISSYCTSRLT